MVQSFFDPSIFKQMMPKQGLSSAPVFDMKQIMETQRKNVQAVSDAMQVSMEYFQTALSRQAEIVGRMVQDNSNLASTLIAEGTPEQKVQRQAELMRKSYETTIKSAREVGDILTKSCEESAEILNRRVSASLSEFKTAFERDADAVKETVSQGVSKAKKAVKTASRAAKKAA